MADQGSRLSERRRREFERDPASTEHRRLPRSEAQGSQTAGSFLGETRKEGAPPGAYPGTRLQNKPSGNYQNNS